MFLSSIEGRIRSWAFDYAVNATDRALRDPQVVQKIGAPLAAQLLEVNASLFLPNVRHEQVVVPAAQKDTANPILLPITLPQAWRIDEMIGAVKSQPVKSWSLNDPIYSEAYDIRSTSAEVTEAAKASASQETMPADQEERVDNTPVVAATTHVKTWLNNDTFSVSRPIVTMRYAAMRGTPRYVATTLVHEEVHAHDDLHEGPVLLLQQHEAASEYRAYFVDEVVQSGKRRFGPDELSYQVEAFRQEHADPARPFHPTPAMVDHMVELGIV